MKNTSYTLAFVMLIGFQAHADTSEKIVNIYNWADYINPTIIKSFEETTGIKVNYAVYSSNEVLETKLLTGNTGYDVVFPGGGFFERQINAEVFHQIDKQQLSHYGNLDDEIKERAQVSDPGNKYGVPYMYGTTGIGYNVDMVTKRLGHPPEHSWDLVFKPENAAKLADCGIAFIDSPAEVTSIALNYLGLDPNSEKQTDLDQVNALLQSVRSSIRYFDSTNILNDLASGDICIAVGYNGDMLLAQARTIEVQNNHHIAYITPKEGSLLWLDVMAIPADAPHKDSAYKFINYILDAEIAASASNYVLFAIANKAAKPYLLDDVKNNTAIYPSQSIKSSLFVLKAHTAKFDRKLSRIWTNIKTNH